MTVSDASLDESGSKLSKVAATSRLYYAIRTSSEAYADFDKWLLDQIKSDPSITSEKLAGLSGKSVITIKRHLKKMKNVRYVGSGYSGHWEVDEK